MINRELLSRAMKSTTIVSYLMPLVLAPLLFVAWILSQDPEGAVPVFSVGEAGAIGLVALTLVSLAPFVIRPLLRNALAKVRRRAAEQPELMAAKPEIFLPMHAQISQLIWDIPATVGFIAFVLGVGWAFFIAAVVITLAGFVVDFPREDAVLQWADEYDARVTGRAPKLPL